MTRAFYIARHGSSSRSTTGCGTKGHIGLDLSSSEPRIVFIKKSWYLRFHPHKLAETAQTSEGGIVLNVARNANDEALAMARTTYFHASLSHDYFYGSTNKFFNICHGRYPVSCRYRLPLFSS